MLHRLLAAAALVLACAAPVLAQPSAGAAAKFQRHALSVSAVEKFTAATREMEKLPRPKGADDKGTDKDGETVDDIVKQLEAHPQAKALIARHGFTPRSYALTALALFQAGFYLAMEPSMDKKKGAALLASYPKETQANIELLRKNPALLKKQ